LAGGERRLGRVRGPSTFVWAAHKAAADMGRGVWLVMVRRVGFRRRRLGALNSPRVPSFKAASPV
jgi:hypothetical protein